MFHDIDSSFFLLSTKIFAILVTDSEPTFPHAELTYQRFSHLFVCLFVCYYFCSWKTCIPTIKSFLIKLWRLTTLCGFKTMLSNPQNGQILVILVSFVAEYFQGEQSLCYTHTTPVIVKEWKIFFFFFLKKILHG